MKGYPRRRTGATRIRARSANINGSTFGNHVRILQGDLNIFRGRDRGELTIVFSLFIS
ncbi:hypothetical protein GGI42DRAFT_327614 [Trichoderma sp. SZMC 28013]